MPLFNEKNKTADHVPLPIGVILSTASSHETKKTGGIVGNLAANERINFVKAIWTDVQEGPYYIPLEESESNTQDFQLVFGTADDMTPGSALFQKMLPVNNKISFLLQYNVTSYFGFNCDVKFIDFHEQNILRLFRFGDLPKYADPLTAKIVVKQLRDQISQSLAKHSALIIDDEAYKPKSSLFCCR